MLFHPNLSESGKTAAVEIHLYSQGTGQARRAGARRWSPRVWSGALRELVGWQGATRTVALACSLPCPEQLKVWRTLPQSTQACTVGGCSLLLQPRFSKASSPGQVICLFTTLTVWDPFAYLVAVLHLG